MGALITVVCRHNQARSVIAAAVARKMFPEIEVISAGVAAVEGQRIPQSILNLAEAWNLDVVESVSHSTQALKERILNSDYVIVAEDEFIPYIFELGVEPQKVLSMQDKRFEHRFIPFDPIGRGNRVVSIEIAKAVMTSMQLLRGQMGFLNRHKVTTAFPSDEADFHAKFGPLWRQVSKADGVLVLADFRAPNYHAVSQFCENLVELKVDRNDQSIDLSGGFHESALEKGLSSGLPFAISARFEMDHVEKFALSAQFSGLIKILASNRPVWILTEPIGIGSCAYLVAANANV